MSTMRMPRNFHETDVEDRVTVSDGDHHVKVSQATEVREGHALIRFEVRKGPEAGLGIDRHYNLEHVLGMRDFKRMLSAAGVKVDAEGILDLDELRGKALCVTVTRREADGRTYANVVGYAPINGAA